MPVLHSAGRVVNGNPPIPADVRGRLQNTQLRFTALTASLRAITNGDSSTPVELLDAIRQQVEDITVQLGQAAADLDEHHALRRFLSTRRP